MADLDRHGHEDGAGDSLRLLDTALGPTLLVNRPERRNALTLSMWEGLGARVLELSARTSGPLYLMGAGGYFSSGADLGALAFARSSEEHAREFVAAVVTALMRLHLLDQQVVAVVEGGAAGGGIEIMAACDRRVAIGAPRLVFPFGHHGMELDGLTRWRLGDLLGEREAERLVDGRHVLEADEAVRLGLFDEQHGSLEEFVRAELPTERHPAVLPADRSTFVRAGEDPAAAVARASVPMLRAFPPHWAG